MTPFQGGSHWPERAVHDTVAAIARGAEYRRGLAESLLGRAFRFLLDLVRDLAEAAAKVPHGRLIAVICAAVIVLLIAARMILAARIQDEQARVRIGRGRVAGATDAWSESQALAAAGRFTEAAHALYHAVLERLAAAGGLQLHSSKTSGDYVRDLRRRGSPAQQDFRAFSRRFDAIIFGTGVCSPEEYESLAAAARRVIVERMAA